MQACFLVSYHSHHICISVQLCIFIDFYVCVHFYCSWYSYPLFLNWGINKGLFYLMHAERTSFLTPQEFTFRERKSLIQSGIIWASNAELHQSCIHLLCNEGIIKYLCEKLHLFQVMSSYSYFNTHCPIKQGFGFWAQRHVIGVEKYVVVGAH